MERDYMKPRLINNVWSILSAIPQGHEKALKHALYNAVALLLLFICSAAGYALFYVLEPFVKPLIWAVLIGSVLHPMKYNLSKRFEDWLNIFENNSTPFVFIIVMIPVHIIDDLSNTIGGFLNKHFKLMLSIVIVIVGVVLIYCYTPCICLTVVDKIVTVIHSCLLLIIEHFSGTLMIALLCCYVALLSLNWTPERNICFIISSYFIWFCNAVYFVKVIGYLQIPLLLFICIAFIGGFIFEVINIFRHLDHVDRTYVQAIKLALEGVKITEDDNIEEEKHQEEIKNILKEESESYGKSALKKNVSGQGDAQVISRYEREVKAEVHFSQEEPQIVERPNKITCSPVLESKHPDVDEGLESDKYLYAVCWCCFVMLIWKYLWVVHFLPIPIFVYIIKNLGFYFGIWSLLKSQMGIIEDRIIVWVTEREIFLLPAPVQGLFKIATKFRAAFLSCCKNSIDSFASSLVIIGLIFFSTCFTLFIALKIYAECIHLISVGAGVINSTVVSNPEFIQLLPEGWGDKMGSVLNDAYLYGREYISSVVRSILKDVDSTKVSELEKQILEFWDRMYQAWLLGALEPSDTIGPKVSSSAVFTSWDNFVEVLNKTPGLLNLDVMTGFAKDNVGTLMSLLESVWLILKGNINLIFHLFFAILSVLLGGGTAVFNFTISFIVFLTALFYLLSSSGRLYKPVELITNFSPINGNKLGVAFAAAINGVFKASFKMALFYGLWTWLIHNLFQVKIVYLPSVLAAIFGAVPFVGTYWASIPAVLDLWLAHHQGLQAIILFIFQCLPTSFVDTAIYNEIKGGGHPYLTALAIAGGVFCMGIEGAILGPLLLCCLLVAINISSSLMKESPVEVRSSVRHLRRMDTMPAF